MAIKIVKTFNVKNSSGALLMNQNIGNPFGAPITKEAETSAAVDALIVAEVQVRAAAAQVPVDTFAEILAALS